MAMTSCIMTRLEIVFLFAGAGLGHHEECEKEDDVDAYDENDVGWATELIP